jgi:hypothetical protein
MNKKKTFKQRKKSELTSLVNISDDKKIQMANLAIVVGDMATNTQS